MSVGKVPEILVGVAPSANSYHDNPVSGIHQAPSHWATTQWKEIVKLTHTYQEGWEGREQKRSVSQLAKGNASLTTTGDQTCFCNALGHPVFTHEAARQHCFEFDLAHVTYMLQMYVALR